MLGHMLLFGRQTDREPRLEVLSVSRRELEEINALLAEVSGGQLSRPNDEKVTGKLSVSQDMLAHNWRLPEGTTQEDLQRLSDQALERAVLSRWPQTPLGLLDGKTPQEVDGQEAYRVKLLAAILILEQWMEQQGGHLEMNRLRAQLGLPALAPIDPQEADLRELPLVRLPRLGLTS